MIFHGKLLSQIWQLNAFFPSWTDAICFFNFLILRTSVITDFTFEWFVSFMNWCNVFSHATFLRKTSATNFPCTVRAPIRLGCTYHSNFVEQMRVISLKGLFMVKKTLFLSKIRCNVRAIFGKNCWFCKVFYILQKWHVFGKDVYLVT